MIQWFPGHMAKAFRQVQEKAAIADLFIVVLDARAPISSYNEDFDKIAPTKPRLFVITKVDLADKEKLDKILTKFNNKADGVVLANLKKQNSHKKIIKEAEKLLAKKRQSDLKKGLLKPRLRAIVIGVPNSGKSTLINTLAKKSVTRVGNRPGVTKGQQWINAGEIQLLDTPGILWPKFEDELIGIKLAIIGSIRIEVIPKLELFYEAYILLSKFYQNKLTDIGLKPTSVKEEIYSQLIEMCERKKFILKEGKINLEKGMMYFINYVRDMRGVTYD